MLHDVQNYLAAIKVIGIGGGGCNAVNRMVDAGLKGVEFIAVNTDAQALLTSDADVNFDIGRERTHGLGAGSDPEVGRDAAEEHREEIEELLKDTDMHRRHRRGWRHGHRRGAGHRRHCQQRRCAHHRDRDPPIQF
jgi:cell division protein FtsZ